jgi:type IV pilus assembly protein PilF
MRQILFPAGILLMLLLEGCSAIQSMKENEEKSERLARTHVELGVGYLRQGKFNVALEKLKKAIEAEPGYSPGHSAIAIVYEKLEHYEKANDHYLEAISLSPDDGNLYNNYGVFLCGREKYLEAEKYFLKAVSTPRYKTPELAYENAGACVRKVSKIKEAEEYLTKALKINPKLPLALVNMAHIRFEQSNFLSTRGFLQRYEGVSQHNADSLWLGVLVERKLGNKSEAQRYAKLLQSNFPKSEEFKLLLNSQGEN